MSTSRMPTCNPRSRKPKARLTAVVDLPTPPLPEATAMIASTPGMPAGDRAGGATCALGGQRDHDRFHARHRADRGLGALAHRFPKFDRAGLDGDREKHLAVGSDDLGQFSSLRQWCAVGARHMTEPGKHVVFEGLHRLIPKLRPGGRV